MIRVFNKQTNRYEKEPIRISKKATWNVASLEQRIAKLEQIVIGLAPQLLVSNYSTSTEALR